MNMGRLLGGASRFAHLAGITRLDTEDDEPKGKTSKKADEDESEDDEPKGKKSKADGDPDQYPDEDDNEPKGKKSKSADEDDDDKSADEDDDEPKGKKSKASDDEDCEDDDDDEEMRGKSAVAQARRRERARCAAIFAQPGAALNPELAASLAFETSMTRQEAIKILKRQRAPSASSGSSERQSRNARLGPGGEGSLSGAKALSASWEHAKQKAGVAGAPRK